jgi:inner membrane protein
MDNLAHALVGAALGRAIADRHVARAGLIGAIAANMPDWAETVMGYWRWSRADFLVHHRGITHSLVGAVVQIPVLVLAIGLSARLWKRGSGRGSIPPWGWLTLCVALTFLSHLIMDWQGSYGWRPFLPWSGRWYYLDWVAIVDPFFWLVPLVALAWGSERHWVPLSGVMSIAAFITILLFVQRDIVAPWVLVLYALIAVVASIGWIRYWVGPVARQRAAACASLLLVAYVGAHAIGAEARKGEIRRIAVRRFGAGASWAALTNIGRPFTWEAIYADTDTVAGDDWQIPRHLHDPVVVRAINDTREGRAIAQFARFLTAEVDTTGAGAVKTVYLRDARYARVGRQGWAVTAVKIK